MRPDTDLNRAKRERLAKLVRAFGFPPPDDALDSVVADVITQAAPNRAPRPAPDTDWQPAIPIDGQPGSWRRLGGRTLVVRQCRGSPAPGWVERIYRWYSTADGGVLVDQGGRYFFDDEAEARAVAEVFEEGSPSLDGHSRAI
jgi:hypothetical protein